MEDLVLVAVSGCTRVWGRGQGLLVSTVRLICVNTLKLTHRMCGNTY